MDLMSESIWWNQNCIEVKAATLKPDSWKFDIFKSWAKSGIFKYISWLNGSSFGDDYQGFLKEGVET
jgi:hypothetical protein